MYNITTSLIPKKKPFEMANHKKEFSVHSGSMGAKRKNGLPMSPKEELAKLFPPVS